ncbi:hypothetical protein [Roseibium sp.]|uniref:hypothetical protein n=1 Tax=Roseibium sp. TaxID=1936156 RepID=UPI0032787C7D
MSDLTKLSNTELAEALNRLLVPFQRSLKVDEQLVRDGIIASLDKSTMGAVALLREAASRLQAPAVAEVEVKPLKWDKTWGGGDEDIPSWRGRNPLGLSVGFSFAGRLFNGRRIDHHDEAPEEAVKAAMLETQADYERRIRSALRTGGSE